MRRRRGGRRRWSATGNTIPSPPTRVRLLPASSPTACRYYAYCSSSVASCVLLATRVWLRAAPHGSRPVSRPVSRLVSRQQCRAAHDAITCTNSTAATTVLSSACDQPTATSPPHRRDCETCLRNPTRFIPPATFNSGNPRIKQNTSALSRRAPDRETLIDLWFLCGGTGAFQPRCAHGLRDPLHGTDNACVCLFQPLYAY